MLILEVLLNSKYNMYKYSAINFFLASMQVKLPYGNSQGQYFIFRK